MTSEQAADWPETRQWSEHLIRGVRAACTCGWRGPIHPDEFGGNLLALLEREKHGDDGDHLGHSHIWSLDLRREPSRPT